MMLFHNGNCHDKQKRMLWETRNGLGLFAENHFVDASYILVVAVMRTKE